MAFDRAGALVAGVPVVTDEKNSLDAGTFVKIGLAQLHCDRRSDAEKSFRRAVARRSAPTTPSNAPISCAKSFGCVRTQPTLSAR